MHRRTRLTLILAAGAVVIGGLAWTALRPVPIPSEYAVLETGPMEVTVDVDGTARIREVWDVAAPITGTAKRSPVRVGNPVTKGETLVAVVEPVAPSLLDVRSRTQAEAAVREAEAAVSVADTRVLQAVEDHEYALTQYARAQALVESGAASLVRLEDASQTLRIKEAALAAAQSSRDLAIGSLERARAALIGPDLDAVSPESCCVQIHAPASGQVLSIEQVSERPVVAGERLLSIGDLHDLEITADPLSRDAVRIPDDAIAHVDRWGGPGSLTARLRQIEPSARTVVSALGIEEQRVEAVFDLTDPPDSRAGLGDGYAVRLSIVVWSAENALQIPLGALFRDSGQWATFAVRDGKAVLTPVEIGESNDRTAEVLSGLKTGDTVITHPGEGIEDGVLVTEAVPD